MTTPSRGVRIHAFAKSRAFRSAPHQQVAPSGEQADSRGRLRWRAACGRGCVATQAANQFRRRQASLGRLEAADTAASADIRADRRGRAAARRRRSPATITRSSSRELTASFLPVQVGSATDRSARRSSHRGVRSRYPGSLAPLCRVSYDAQAADAPYSQAGGLRAELTIGGVSRAVARARDSAHIQRRPRPGPTGHRLHRGGGLRYQTLAALPHEIGIVLRSPTDLL